MRFLTIRPDIGSFIIKAKPPENRVNILLSRRNALSINGSPVKNEIEMHGRTLRMSLVLSAIGRWTIARLCTGRRAYSARDGGQHAPRPLVATQYGLPRAPRCPGEPGGSSRPDGRLACNRRSLYPAAHPQR